MVEKIKTLGKDKVVLERIVSHMEAKVGPLKERVHKLEGEVVDYQSRIRSLENEFKMNIDEKEATKTLL